MTVVTAVLLIKKLCFEFHIGLSIADSGDSGYPQKNSMGFWTSNGFNIDDSGDSVFFNEKIVFSISHGLNNDIGDRGLLMKICQGVDS